MEDKENHEEKRSRIDNDEILLNLPFKALVQISCCSRNLKTRIRSREFTKMYVKVSLEANTNRSLVYSYNSPTIPGTETMFTITEIENDTGDGIFRESFGRFVERPPFRALPRALRTEIVGHSYGLVCVASHQYTMTHNFNRTLGLVYSPAYNPRLSIWNPSISMYHRVPALTWFELPIYDKYVIRYPPSYGFGFNPRTDSHEIVWFGQLFSYKTKLFTTQVQIYSLRTSNWNRLEDLEIRDKRGNNSIYEISPGFNEERAFGSPFLRNHLHWMLAPEERFHDQARVLAFNLQTRRFSNFRAPTFVSLKSGEGCGARICAIGERLAFVESLSVGILRVWLMSEYGNESSWFAAYDVVLEVWPYHYYRLVSGDPLLVAGRWNELALFVLNYDGFRGVNGGVSFVRSLFLVEDGEKCPQGTALIVA